MTKDLAYDVNLLGFKTQLLTCGCDIGQVTAPSARMFVLNMLIVPKTFSGENLSITQIYHLLTHSFLLKKY